MTFDSIDHAYTRRRRRKDAAFRLLCFGVASLTVVILLALLGKIIVDGAGRLDWSFIVSRPSEMKELRGGGVFPALVGSAVVVALSAIMVVPVGVASAVFLEEMVRQKNWFTETIEVNINNLSGVPSIVYGMLGLGIFTGVFHMGKGVIVGALTMAILILPMVILISREALRAVPKSYREASLALGASEGRTIWRVVLPNALPGILTGIILSISRAIGETAPLIVVGAVTTVTFLPRDLNDSYSSLPLLIFNWSGRPQPHFHVAAASAIIVLMAALLILNSIAIAVRARAQSKRRA